MQALYACHGKEPLPAPFLFALSQRIDDIVVNDTNAITVAADDDTARGGFSPTQSNSSSQTVTDVAKNGSEDNDGGRIAPPVDSSHDDLRSASNLSTTIDDGGSSCCTSSAEGGTRKSTVVATTSSTGAASSTATATVATRAPKLMDFYDTANVDTCDELWEAREYLAKFREFVLGKSVLEGGSEGPENWINTLNVSAMARYAFHVRACSRR